MDHGITLEEYFLRKRSLDKVGATAWSGEARILDVKAEPGYITASVTVDTPRARIEGLPIPWGCPITIKGEPAALSI